MPNAGGLATLARVRMGTQDSAWIKVDDAALAMDIDEHCQSAKVEQVTAAISELKPDLMKLGIGANIRSGTHVYVYKRSAEDMKETDMNDGEVKLVPGVLNRVASTSEPGKEHEVRLSKNGNIYCDCEGYAYRGHCSHIDATIKTVPMLKVLVVASIRNRIAHMKETLAKLDE